MFQAGVIDKGQLQERLRRIDVSRARLEKERDALRSDAAVSQDARRRAWLGAVRGLEVASAEKALRDKLIRVDGEGRSPLAALRQRVVRGVFERVTFKKDGGLEYAAVVPGAIKDTRFGRCVPPSGVPGTEPSPPSIRIFLPPC